jgi:hypothetical protein
VQQSAVLQRLGQAFAQPFEVDRFEQIIERTELDAVDADRDGCISLSA